MNVKKLTEKSCKECFWNHNCPLPQSGYDYNPNNCEYNPDNKKRKEYYGN